MKDFKLGDEYYFVGDLSGSDEIISGPHEVDAFHVNLMLGHRGPIIRSLMHGSEDEALVYVLNCLEMDIGEAKDSLNIALNSINHIKGYLKKRRRS